MMNSKVFYPLFIIAFYLTGNCFSQSKPYFQQEVNYTINVTLNDVKHELSAFESIEYINNSPDALKEIYMHLWPNAYKDNNTALAKQLIESGDLKLYYSSSDQRGYIDSLDFKVNGSAVKWEFDPQHIDIAKIFLNEPLAPGAKLIISTPFHVKVPIGVFSRLGHLDQAYQITQWYPKPAVYDKNGWNQMPYLNQGEFYSEFGSFDVSISLPKNYVVAATGDLVDGENEREWLLEKVKQTETKTEFKKEDDKHPVSDTHWKTLRYKQSNVHDFAWFADKRFHVLRGEVELPHSKQKVETWVMFLNSQAKLWMKSIQYMNDAIYYYSLWNGDYPYKHATAIDGALTAGGGMEYPNVTVIGTSGNDFLLETVIMHEVGHNWFYGILGSNERIHPWMDEGLNSYNELRYIRTKYPEKKLVGAFAEKSLARTLDLAHYKQKAQYDLAYLVNARRNLDQPIELPAAEYTELNYGGIVYSKTALAFDYLRAYLGDETMDKAMNQYFETWKFKHPQPDDLRAVLESSIGKNLGWLFDEMIPTTKKLDYKIVSLSRGPAFFSITIKNNGEIKGPFSIYGLKDGNIRASIWYDGFEGRKAFSFPPGEFDSFVIDELDEMPEVNKKNNTLKTHGLFKKVEPVRLQFLGSLENPKRTQIFYTPIAGWNNYNKLMLGVALYNNTIPQKKFEYVLAPMYSFHANEFSGLGELAMNWYPKNVFQNIRLSGYAAHFGINDLVRFDPNAKNDLLNYTKLTPKITFELKKKNARSPVKNLIELRSVNILEDNVKYVVAAGEFTVEEVNDHFMVNQIKYKMTNSRSLNPFNIILDVQQNKDFVRSSLEGNYRFSYKQKKKGVDIRLFAGKFLYDNNANGRFGFGFSGNTDYLYDQIFLGRNETSGILNQQFAINDGGFKNYTTVSLSKNWMTTINIQASIPKLPLAFYADGGFSSPSKGLVYDAGVALVVIPKIFEIYCPITTSSNLNQLKYGEKIRYTLNINLLNPFEFARNFSM